MSFAIWLNFLKVHGNAIVMVIKTIAFTIILKFHSPDGIFSKRIKKKKIGIEEIVQIYVPSLEFKLDLWSVKAKYFFNLEKNAKEFFF